MRAVILQPTYLPWMGYFGVIDIADVFVFCDDIQFEQKSWQQRNKIKTSNREWIWLSVPTIHNFGQNINKVRISDSYNWRKKHWQFIYQSYTKAPYFKDYKDDIENIYQNDWEYLSELNIYVIQKLSKLLGIDLQKIIKTSEIKDIVGTKTDRALSILEKIGADEYISGPAAKDYIEIDKFRERGINLYWYEYQHPVYPQIKGDFISYLSAIDLLFNTGDEAIKYIREGSKNALKRTDTD